MGLKTKIISVNEYAKGITTKTRLVLLMSILVAIACFIIGILIGHYGIDKSSGNEHDEKEDGDRGSLRDECKRGQFTEAHKAYSDR